MGEDVLGGKASAPFHRRQPPPGSLRRRSGGAERAVRTGKLPKSRQKPAARPAAQGGPAILKEQEHRPLLRPPGLFGGLYGQQPRRSRPAGKAHVRQRAERTLRRAVWPADHCAQLHQRLIEHADVLRSVRHGGTQRLPHGPLRFRICDVRAPVRQPRDHPQHVSVHRRLRQGERRRGHGGGGILPHAGEGEQRAVFGGEPPAELADDGPGRLLKISGPAVIAKPLPELHQPLLRRVRQSFHRGEGLQKPPVIADHRRGAGLLEHDLRHPDAVRVLCLPPRQGAGVGAVPRQKRRGDGRKGCQTGLRHGIINSCSGAADGAF